MIIEPPCVSVFESSLWLHDVYKKIHPVSNSNFDSYWSPILQEMLLGDLGHLEIRGDHPIRVHFPSMWRILANWDNIDLILRKRNVLSSNQTNSKSAIGIVQNLSRTLLNLHRGGWGPLEEYVCSVMNFFCLLSKIQTNTPICQVPSFSSPFGRTRFLNGSLTHTGPGNMINSKENEQDIM